MSLQLDPLGQHVISDCGISSVCIHCSHTTRAIWVLSFIPVL